VERTAVLGDRVGEEAMVRLAVRLGALLAELGSERRRADKIRKEDRRGCR